MTLRQLLEDQKVEVDDLLDAEIGSPNGSGPKIRVDLGDPEGATVSITLPPAWGKEPY